MARPAACVACRQNKLRCNASSTFPASCSRCAGRHIECKVDMNYKRVPTRNRVERLTQELTTLRASLQIQSNKDDAWPSHSSLSQSSTSTGDCPFPAASRAEAISGFLGMSPHRTPTGEHDTVFKLEDLVLPETDVNELFQEYYAQYHHQLPVLDEQIEPAAIIDASPLLFWTICFTASRNLLPQQHYFPILCKKVTGLLSNLMMVRHNSVYTMQALLILTMWPPPVRRQSDDMRWTYSGMTLQMVLQAGCHRVGYEHEYHGFTYSESPSDERDERKHTQIWRCWCFVNSLLSCELGLPCLVPFDALVIKPSDEAALPSDFISKLRIVFYVSRINDTLGDSSPKDGRHWMAVARLLEKDLKSLVSELSKSSALWNSTVEYVYLAVLLYVYSFCLRWASAIPLSDPDHAIIQTSAAQSACRLIELYANSLLSPSNGTSPTSASCPQRYYAKSYIQFNNIALIILVKISAFNRVSLPQLGEVNDAIRLGHSALMACSSSRGDESYRAAAVVEVLCKRGVIKPVGGDSPVQSRFGASLWLELLATAIRWRRQNSQERIRPRDSTIASNDNDCNNGSEGIAEPLTSSRVSGPGNAAVATPIAVGQVAGPATTLADLQETINVFPFSVEDWSAYLDIIQADTELGYDLGV